MNHEIDVSFKLDDPGQHLALRSEAALFGALLQAVTHAFSFPVAAMVGSVIVTVTQAYLDIQLELNVRRVHTQIARQQATGMLISRALFELADERTYHPQVAALLERSLINLLATELVKAGG